MLAKLKSFLYKYIPANQPWPPPHTPLLSTRRQKSGPSADEAAASAPPSLRCRWSRPQKCDLRHTLSGIHLINPLIC